MKPILVLTLLWVASLGNFLGCSTGSDELTPQQVCNGVVGAACEWMERCAETAGSPALGKYTSVADCRAQVGANSCAARSGNCPPDQTFHPDKAQQCIDAFQSFSCTSTTNRPDVCNQICQAESNPAPAKAVPQFSNLSDPWYPAPFSTDMGDYWRGAGIPFDGMNYYLLTTPAAGNSWSERFNPDSKYFQAWVGVYTVWDSNGVAYGFQNGELDANAIALLGVVDQVHWLEEVGGITSPIVKLDDTVPLTKEATAIDGAPGWKLTCRLKTQSDTGDYNPASGLPSFLIVPKSAWELRIASNQEIFLDICLYAWYSEQHGQLNVIYYNSASFTDLGGNAVETKPAVFAELDAIARSITLK